MDILVETPVAAAQAQMSGEGPLLRGKNLTAWP